MQTFSKTCLFGGKCNWLRRIPWNFSKIFRKISRICRIFLGDATENCSNTCFCMYNSFCGGFSHHFLSAGIQTETSVEADGWMGWTSTTLMIPNGKKSIPFSIQPTYLRDMLWWYSVFLPVFWGDQGGGKCATELGSQALLGLHAVHQKLKRIPGDHSGCDAEVLKATGGVMWGVFFWLKDVKERKFCCIFRPCFSTSLLANSCWEEKTPGRAGRWQQSLQILEEAAAKIRPMPGIAGTGRERWEMMSLEHWWQKNPLGVGVFHMGKVFPNDDIFRKLFFFTYFNQTELKGWRFRGICSYIYIYIYIMYINFIIFRALSGNPPKNKQYLYNALKQTISFFSEKVSIPEVSTSKFDGEILGHLPLETLGPCRCPARISALESSCLVLRGKFFWTPVPYAQETTTSTTLVTAPAPAPPTST